ncbi:MAG: MFS transporter, partial [Chloroflexota bacterium]
LFALGLALSSRGSALWHYYLAFGLLAGVGLCLMGAVPFTRVLSNWFVRRRALALSFVFVGSGSGFLLYPLVAFLIERWGWRVALLVEAGLVAVLLLPGIVLLLRRHPAEKGLLPDGGGTGVPAEGKEAIVAPAPDTIPAYAQWTLPKAMKSLRFWLLCLSAFSVWGLTEHIMVAHHVAFAEDVGYSKLYAASVLALFGVFMAAGSLAGSISDRIGREVTFTVGTIIGVSGIGALTLIQDTSQPWLLYLYAILFGFGFGMTSPTLAAAATDMFPGPRAGAVIGFVWFAFAMGGTIGPWLGGAIFEAGGSYLPAFIVAAAMFAVACIAFWVAAPRHARPVTGRAGRGRG